MSRAPDGGGEVSPAGQLRQSLETLAAPSDLQLDLFPDLTSTPDHMALEFEHWHDVIIETSPDNLTAAQARALAELDQQLDAMADGDESLWTRSALRDSPRWESVRELARAALDLFGWSSDADEET